MVVYPVQVQGEQAKFDIVAALETAAARAECDVLILARGGGSLEDLWAFNEEIVARAIAACPIPLVSGVGHEVDFTIADLVADVRAPTPSGAAELAVPDGRDWLRRVQVLERRLALTARRARGRRAGWPSARSTPASPAATRASCSGRTPSASTNSARSSAPPCATGSPWTSCASATRWPACAATRRRSGCAWPRTASPTPGCGSPPRPAAGSPRPGTQLAVLSGRLHTVSPLRTLERGYAIVLDAAGNVVRSTAQVQPGDADHGPRRRRHHQGHRP